MPATVRSSLFGQSAALQNAGVKPEDAAGAAVKPANPKKNLRHRNIRARLHFQTCRPALRKQAPRNAKSATSESRKRQTFYIVSNRNHTNGYVCARVKYLRQFRRATAAESGACAPRGSRKKNRISGLKAAARSPWCPGARKGAKNSPPRRAPSSPDFPPAAPAGKLIYNSVRLPEKWPPDFSSKSDEPAKIPYLENPPKTIRIDVGRQLFADDFLVEKTRGIKMEFQYPRKYAGNPLLNPETELERRGNPVAALSGSILWNPDKRIFEMWHEAGHLKNLAHVYSKDGLKWERAYIKGGTNKILDRNRDSWTVDAAGAKPTPRKNLKCFSERLTANAISAPKPTCRPTA